MTVKDLRDRLAGLPETMRIVTPDFLDTYFLTSEVGRDTFVAIITDVDPVENATHPFDPIGGYYTREDESY